MHYIHRLINIMGLLIAVKRNMESLLSGVCAQKEIIHIYISG